MATDTYIEIPAVGSPSWKDPVANAGSLPLTGNTNGDTRVDLSTDTIYVWNGSSWVAVATPGAAIAIDGLIGDATASGPGVVPITFATVNGNVGTFGSASNVAQVTVNGKGLTTAASNVAIQIAENQVTNLVSDLAGKQPTGNYITALTGDVTASGPGSVAATLATVNSNVGSFGSSTQIPSFTVNGKGLITAASNNSITTGNLTIGTYDSQTAVANGLQIISGVLYAQSATASFPGMVSIGTQTFAGAKTFNNNLTIASNSTSALIINTSSFVFDSTNFAIGINNASPSSATFIDGINTSNATKRLLLTGYGSASLVGFRTRLARNTVGTPQAVQSGDILGFFNVEGYGTSQFPATGTGAITFLAQETFTNTSNATSCNINTTPTGAVTSTVSLTVKTTGQLQAPAFYTSAGTIQTDASGNFTSSSTSTMRTSLGIDAGQSFLTSGTTFTTPANTTTATVWKFTLVGGGGGGPGVTNTTNLMGSAGGAGGVGVHFATNIAGNTALTYAIGAAGSAGSSGTNNGGTGGNTTITIAATTYTAGGGGPGISAASNAGGAGGTLTNFVAGDITITGQVGQTSPSVSALVQTPIGGTPGMGFGLPGYGNVPGGNSAGQAGTGFGYGGQSGRAGNTSPASQTGAAGGAGCILAEYWN